MGKSLNVLFVEDSEDDVELTVNELIHGGFAPVTRRVETEPEMQNALDTQGWDIVICDYRMPKFSAEKALECLQDSSRDLPFIILSGVVGSEEAVTLLKRGAHDFLNKNKLARLIPAIERELRDSVMRCERKRAEERVRILSLTVEQSPVSVVVTDMHGIITYVNPKFENITGYQSHQAIGEHLDFTLNKQESGALFEEVRSSMQQGQEWRGELCNLRGDGQLFWEYANISPLINDNGDVTHFIAVKEDITIRRSYEEQLLRQARYDELTGLANRAQLQENLDLAINNAYLNNTSGALLCIDLDNFKNINDTLGHSVGDELLIEAVSRLATCVRREDTLARMGGDEFAVVLTSIDNETSIIRVAERIVDLFSQPFLIREQEHIVTSSIGIATFPNDGDNQQILLRNADLAMYKSKDCGRNQYQFFTEEINRKLNERVILESRLREAIVQQEFILHYQPVIDLKTEKTVGYEALVRWQQSDGSLCMPNDFIPLAESVGLIVDIGKWVITTACRDLTRMTKCSNHQLKMAINVSPRQLLAEDFTFFVEQQIEIFNLRPEQIELEVTESVLIDEQPVTCANVSALSELGVSLSIDDFGTGYSALSYLHKYPFKTLKIDRSFINNLSASQSSERLVETIINMAHNLGLNVIAEGVETREQLEFLSSPDCFCDQIQGYYYGKPEVISKYFPALENLHGVNAATS